MHRVIVVERPTETDVAKLVQLERCCSIREITLVQTIRTADREIVVYDAEDAQRVRDSYHSAGVAFTRVSPAELHSNK